MPYLTASPRGMATFPPMPRFPHTGRRWLPHLMAQILARCAQTVTFMEGLNFAAGAAAARQVNAPGAMHYRHPRAQSARRAFLLEDNDANGYVIGGMLDLLGYKEVVWVKTMADVASYETEILNGEFSILLIDIMLPDGESFGLLKKLKSAGVERLCVYTARTSAADYKRFNAIGCDHVFEKPLTLDSFTSGHDALFRTTPKR